MNYTLFSNHGKWNNKGYACHGILQVTNTGYHMYRHYVLNKTSTHLSSIQPSLFPVFNHIGYYNNNIWTITQNNEQICLIYPLMTIPFKWYLKWLIHKLRTRVFLNENVDSLKFNFHKKKLMSKIPFRNKKRYLILLPYNLKSLKC